MKWTEIITESSEQAYLDSLLQQCLDQIYSSWDGNVQSGAVGAAVILPSGEIVFGVSTKSKDGLWIHAERQAINKVVEKYGKVPENSKILTTLEPCFDTMPNRVGCSCSELIHQNNIDFTYCGLEDDMQQELNPDYVHPFEIQFSKDAGIKFQCDKLYDTIPPVNTKP